jgi:hypothetical protein
MADSKRTEQVKIRMSPDEVQRLRDIAQQLSTTPSDLLRDSFEPYGKDLLNRRRRRMQRGTECQQ